MEYSRRNIICVRSLVWKTYVLMYAHNLFWRTLVYI